MPSGAALREQDLERREGRREPQETGGQQEASVAPPTHHSPSQSASYLVHCAGEAAEGGTVLHKQARGRWNIHRPLQVQAPCSLSDMGES